MTTDDVPAATDHGLVRSPEGLALLASFPRLRHKAYTRVDVEPGWEGLVSLLLGDISSVLGSTEAELTILQIKEKLGTLRVYYRLERATASQTTVIAALVSRAYAASVRTCRFIALRGEGRR